jgi:hypothetical protein
VDGFVIISLIIFSIGIIAIGTIAVLLSLRRYKDIQKYERDKGASKIP